MCPAVLSAFVLLCDSALVRETCQESLPVQTGLQRKGVGELGEGIPRRRTGCEGLRGRGSLGRAVGGGHDINKELDTQALWVP